MITNCNECEYLRTYNDSLSMKYPVLLKNENEWRYYEDIQDGESFCLEFASFDMKLRCFYATRVNPEEDGCSFGLKKGEEK